MPLPQLFNILKGNFSFLGPHLPLHRYVERFPTLYANVFKDRPGVPGFATLNYHQTADKPLEERETPSGTGTMYERLCVPRKTQLDLPISKRCWLELISPDGGDGVFPGCAVLPPGPYQMASVTALHLASPSCDIWFQGIEPGYALRAG